MAQQERIAEPGGEKLSAEFRRRLSSAAPGHALRAVVLLRTDATRPATGRRSDRQGAVRAVRAAAAAVKADLDAILDRAGGRWLSDAPDALGSIGVEATAAALMELATSEHVRAILEDQRVTALPKPKR